MSVSAVSRRPYAEPKVLMVRDSMDSMYLRSALRQRIKTTRELAAASINYGLRESFLEEARSLEIMLGEL